LDEGIRCSGDGGDDDDDGDGGDDDGGYSGDDGDDNDGGYDGDGNNDEENHGVGKSQRGGTMTWIQSIMPHKIQIMEADRGFHNSVGIWIGWLI